MVKVQKILTYVIAIIGALAAYLWVAIARNEDPVISDIDSFYALTVVMLSVTVGITVLATLIQVFTDTAKLKSAIFALAIIGGIVFISYNLASDAVVSFLGVDLSNPIESKWVGTGLYTTYIAGTLAILSIAFSPLFKLLK
ncbi:MAG: hypothetical protein KAG96_01775 [Ichthyobacteriaceae bacterium]|nr:hypothetical protein [Ichthyobacteriaceae bacterium]